MAKYVKTEQGYVDASIFAPAQFKPEGKSYLTFSSPKNFTLEVNNRTKNWDGILEYFASDKTWTVWDGTTILSGHNNDGEYVLYLRGTGNTKITGMGTNINWIITGTDIKCIGNIENLLDYATVASGKHPTMAKFCYSQMFYGCTSLTQAPELPATTLAYYCYSQMFSGCTSLTQAPELPATTLAKSCYFSMFSNCTALTQAPTLPATTLEADCYSNMFYGCTSLTQAPALTATTLTEGCYGGMFSGCTALTQAPALPATTLENACYRSMFQGCTSLKLSSTKTGEYTQEYRIPSSGTGTIHGYALTDMFVSTGGTFTGTPAINTTYYLSTDNMIVRDTEVATLNGYVGSMIDNSVSNPLNITGATVGQIAKITAVDESGKPTSWEAMDMPSGEGKWNIVHEQTITEDIEAFSYDITGAQAAAIIVAPNASVAGGWKRFILNGKQIPFFNGAVQEPCGVAIVIDLKALIKAQAFVDVTVKNLETYGLTGAIRIALTAGGISEITNIGIGAKELLPVGAKVTIYTKGGNYENL